MAAEKVVRIEDVARLAGVSTTTVSRVINRIPTVKEHHRLKVEEAIRRLGYRPNIAAQHLASGRSHTVGLVIPRYEGIFYSFYGIEILRGVGTLCEALRLDLLLHIAGGAKNSFNYSSFGGILFADIIGNRHQVEGALHSQVPLVVLNYRADDLQASYIAIDNLKGAREAVEYLLNLGHRRIGIITGDLLTQAAQDRLQGYQEALQKKKIEPLEELIFKGDFSRRSARVGMHKLLKLKDPPTAIFACSDDMAKEAISVAMEIGSKVPEDISVVGFDDNPISLVGPVTLTTVRQPLVKMAEEGLKELGVLMRGEKRPLRKTLLPTELIVRDSCLPPR